MRQIIKDAGLSITELAKLCRVSRGTVYAWTRGGLPKNEFLLEEAEKVLGKIVRATKAGKLPSEIPRGNRVEALKKILADF